MKTWNENYGEDADGNRGVKTFMYELEGTEQEVEDIVEILYDDFISCDSCSGNKEIEYEGVEGVEIDIDDYHEELIKRVENDFDLEVNDVIEIAKELDNYVLDPYKIIYNFGYNKAKDEHKITVSTGAKDEQ